MYTKQNQKKIGIKKAVMLRFLIVEKLSIVQFGLNCLIKEKFDEAELDFSLNEELALSRMESTKYDLVFLSIFNIDKPMFEFIRQARKCNPQLKIIVCTPFQDYNLLVEYYKAGVNGIVLQQDDSLEIVRTISEVLLLKNYVSNEVFKIIIHGSPVMESPKPSAIPLSRREQQIASFLITGKKTSSIAQSLNLCNSTISTHKAKIFTKSGVSNVIELKKKLGDLKLFGY